jgi:ferrochelatase
VAEKEKKKTIAVLLLNLGGPDSLRAVRPFLYNLFSDREIIRLGPTLLQKPIAWFISARRSGKSEQMYSLIGNKSPILDITRAQAEALEKSLNSSLTTHHSSLSFKVYIGMRYWHPFVKDTVQQMLNDGITEMIAVTLYPQYSKATTGSSVSELKRVLKGRDINVTYVEQWYDSPFYIDALSDLIYRGISEFGKKSFELLFSAHNLPEDFIRDGDPYVEHTKRTIDEIIKRLSLDPYHVTGMKWHLSFQSKSGPVQWLQPSTDETIIELAKRGVHNVLIVPVSFVSDHIETLYEIDILYKDLAQKHGLNLKRCQSLNMSDKFIEALKELVIAKLK